MTCICIPKAYRLLYLWCNNSYLPSLTTLCIHIRPPERFFTHEIHTVYGLEWFSRFCIFALSKITLLQTEICQRQVLNLEVTVLSVPIISGTIMVLTFHILSSSSFSPECITGFSYSIPLMLSPGITASHTITAPPYLLPCDHHVWLVCFYLSSVWIPGPNGFLVASIWS